MKKYVALLSLTVLGSFVTSRAMEKEDCSKESRVVTLISRDGCEIKIARDAAEQSGALRALLSFSTEEASGKSVTLRKIDGSTLNFVVKCLEGAKNAELSADKDADLVEVAAEKVEDALRAEGFTASDHELNRLIEGHSSLTGAADFLDLSISIYRGIAKAYLPTLERRLVELKKQFDDEEVHLEDYADEYTLYLPCSGQKHCEQFFWNEVAREYHIKHQKELEVEFVYREKGFVGDYWRVVTNTHKFAYGFSIRELRKYKPDYSDIADYLDDGELNLCSKKINSLDGLLTIPGIKTVTHLVLACNQLTTIPENIFDELGNLQRLRLDHNQLASLPANCFDRLGKLVELNLSDNQLTTLPESIFDGLDNLPMVYARDNCFSEEEKARLKEQLGDKVKL